MTNPQHTDPHIPIGRQILKAFRDALALPESTSFQEGYFAASLCAILEDFHLHQAPTHRFRNKPTSKETTQ
jgi:hypothetical protein